MDSFEDFDGLGLAERVANGDATPDGLLDAALARIEARDGRYNAIVGRFEDAARLRDELAEARRVAAAVPSVAPAASPARR